MFRRRLLEFATLATIVTSLFCASIHWGSHVNYFFEAYVLCSILATKQAVLSWRFFRRRANFSRIQFIRIVVCLGIAAFVGVRLPTVVRECEDEVADWKVQSLDQQVSTLSGEIFTTFPMLALRRPSPPTLMDWMLFGQHVRLGDLSGDTLMDRITSRKFDAIIIDPIFVDFDNLLLPKGFRKRLFENYMTFARWKDVVILRPR